MTTMTLNEFVPNAIRTESVVPTINFNQEQFWALMNAAIALGEVMDIVKKTVFYKRDINVEAWNKYIEQIQYNIAVVQRSGSPNWLKEGQKGDVGIENTRLFHAAIGMYTESVEMLQAIDSATRNGEPVDRVNFGEETFDTAWYQAIAWDELGINPEDGLYTVIAKLRKRYPEKYTNENAINRDLVGEREILEQGFDKK